MSDNISIIGGADGPTSVFVAGKLGMNWLNTFGLVLVILLLIPNIIYAVRVKNQKNKCTNKFMNILEQIGRYGCMFLMIFNIGIVESGFPSINAFIIYLVGNTVLMLSYWIIWMLYFNKPDLYLPGTKASDILSFRDYPSIPGLHLWQRLHGLLREKWGVQFLPRYFPSENGGREHVHTWR